MVVAVRAEASIDAEGVLPLALVDQMLKRDGDDDTMLVEVHRATALDWVERHTGLSLQLRAWRVTVDRVRCAVPLPIAPVTAITAVGYVGTPAAVGTWQLDGNTFVPSGTEWGMNSSRGIEIAVTAGFVDVAIQAPGLRTAALLLIKHLYDGGSLAEVPATVHMLCDSYRVPVIG